MMTDFTAHEAAVHDAKNLPVMVPAKLVGRDMTLAQIYTHLKDNQSVLLYGVGGVGKTALASTLASAYADMPGGVLWLNLTAQQNSLAEMLVMVGRAYMVDEITASEDPLAMVGAVANTLTQHKPLVVLDGQFDLTVAAEFVSRCVNDSPALVISETNVPGDWQPFEIMPLERDPAVAMFKHLAGLEGSDQADGDIGGLVEQLEYIPLAIAVAAGAVRANKVAPAQFAAAVPQQPGLSTPQLVLATVFRTLNSAFQGLMLFLGATLTGQASANLLSMVSGQPEANIEQAMNLLVQRQLVERFQRYDLTHYRFHPMVHAFTQPVLKGSGKLETLQVRMRDVVLEYAQKYGTVPDLDFDRLATEMETFLAVAHWAEQAGNKDVANKLSVALSQAEDFVSERGYLFELLQLRRLAATITDAFPAHTNLGDAPPPFTSTIPDTASEESEELEIIEDLVDDEVTADQLDVQPTDLDADSMEPDEQPTLQDVAGALEPQETSDIARLKALLFRAREQGDQQQQAELLTQMGQLQLREGNENEALMTLSEALPLLEAVQDTRGLLATLDTLATLTAKTNNVQASLLHASRGVPLAQQLNDSARLVNLLTITGDAHQNLGESTKAMQTYTEALEQARAGGDAGSEADLLGKLGYAQLDDGNPQAAIQTWENALTLVKAQNRRDAEGRMLGGLGTAYGELGRWQEAINFHTSALYIAREVKDREEESLQLSNLGYASIQANQLGEAVLRYRQALHLAYEMNNRDNIVSTIVDLVRLLVESPRHLSIAQLLIDDALQTEPSDRDVSKLKERIDSELQTAQANGVELISVNGTAQLYAANAYQLLDA